MLDLKKKISFFLTSNLNKTKKNNDLFIANWSLSETPINFRKNFLKIITSSKYILICFQEKFESIDNLKYFNSLKLKLSKKFDIKIKKNKFYKGNIFNQTKSLFFFR